MHALLFRNNHSPYIYSSTSSNYSNISHGHALILTTTLCILYIYYSILYSQLHRILGDQSEWLASYALTKICKIRCLFMYKLFTQQQKCFAVLLKQHFYNPLYRAITTQVTMHYQLPHTRIQCKTPDSQNSKIVINVKILVSQLYYFGILANQLATMTEQL